MIRGLLLMAGLVLVAAAGGEAVCRIVRSSVLPVELAAVVGLVAGEIGLLPVGLYRGGDPAVRFQMAWLGSILHLVLSAGVGAAMFFVLRPATTPFVLALLAMYWVTLAGLCGVLVRAMRTPPIPPRGAPGIAPGGTGILPADAG